MISLPKFKVNEQIAKHGIIIIVGTEGKKEILLKILRQERFEDEEIHFFTTDMHFDKDEWLEKDDELDFHIHSSIEDLDEVCELWNSKRFSIKLERQDMKEKSAVIAFYRFLQREDYNFDAVKDLVFNSQCRKIRVILVVDSIMDILPTIFFNARQIIFLKQKYLSERKYIHQRFFGGLPFEKFQEVFNTTTENGNVLLLETTPTEKDLSKKMFLMESN